MIIIIPMIGFKPMDFMKYCVHVFETKNEIVYRITFCKIHLSSFLNANFLIFKLYLLNF